MPCRRARASGAVLLALASGAACRDAGSSGSTVGGSLPPPTFATDVGPLLAAHCAPCHRPGQGTPFNLLTFEEARAHAREIVDATSAREMPPWLPAPIEPAFIGERRLTDRQIATLRRWADSGAAPGDLAALPPPRPSSGAWQSGTPDLVLRPERPYALAAGGGDVFRNLVIRTGITEDRFVRAVEFNPGDAPVHHAVVHLDGTAGSRSRDGQDGRAGFDGMGAPGTQEPEGHFVGWAPGRGAIVAAEGRPWRLARGTDLVVELHLMPQASPALVRPSVALFFAEGTSNAAPIMVQMGSNAIDIPPGASDYAVTDSYVLPVDANLLSLYPHAHFLGRTMQVHAILPDGRSRTLLHIPRWSFHWQQDYRYSSPIALPRGTTISMRFTYDNSEANVDNPSRPPVRVTAGQRSTDEMANLLLQLLPVSPGDRARIEQDVTVRAAAARLAEAEAAVAANPRDTAALTRLGAGYADAGRLSDAIDTLGRALAIDVGSWAAHHELGGALFKAGRIRDALPHLQQAARLQPGDATVAFNLGKALAASGSAVAARAALSRAIALRPGFAEAWDELGVLLFAGGQVQEAIRHLRKAVDLAPESAVAHSDLGGALAHAGLVSEALMHLRKALTIDPANAAARENLARLRKER